MEDASSLLLVTLVFRGRSADAALPHASATTADLLPALLAALPDLSPLGLGDARFVVRGSLLSPSDAAPLAPLLHARGESADTRARILVQATTAAERDGLASAAAAAPRLRDDLALRPHAAPRPPSPPKQLHGGSAADGDLHGFGTAVALRGLPDEDEAHAVLVRVARDTRVLAVMRARKWYVPVLSELYPDGQVGIDPVCVLGLNMNAGHEIKLRVRTDDLRGFRKYEILMETVMHELAHNQLSEHTHEFYALVSELKREGDRLDWTRSPGHVLDSGTTIFRREAGSASSLRPPAIAGGSGVLGGGGGVRGHLVDDCRKSGRPDAAREAVDTVLGIAARALQPGADAAKVRQLRLANAAFVRKTLRSAGAVDFLVAAGFRRTDNGERLHLEDNFDVAALYLAREVASEVLSEL